jgi:5-formyltetrahydrofolate cyclo-ligase
MPESSVNQPLTQNIVALRSTARRTRSDMPKATIRRNCQLLTRYFFASRIYQKSRRIAFYYPVKNEAGSIDILMQSLQDGKECFLPVINRTSHSMKFIRTGAGTVLKENAYSIPEPVGLSSMPISHFDAILIPLLGFDRFGSRIGMGGGYYDRTLEFTRYDQYYRRPRLIGFAHDNQKQLAITPQAWDIPLDGIFTESGFKLFTHYN